MNEKEINELIKVESMPKIFSQLELIGKEIDEKIKDLDKLECTDENKSELKKRKREITNFKEIMERRRVDIKKEILKPYDIFNRKYEEEVLNKLTDAENLLSSKYKEMEDLQKEEKKAELQEFVRSHCEENNINVDFDKIGLNITLSASMKSLKDQAKAYIDKVVQDLDLISLEEYKDEIKLEYDKTMDFVTAKKTVLERHRLLEEIKKQQENRQALKEQEEKIEEKVEEIIAPVEIIEDDEIIEVQFTLKGKKNEIKKVKELILELGLKYK